MKRVARRDQIDELVRVAVGEVDEERFSDLVVVLGEYCWGGRGARGGCRGDRT